MPSLQDIKEKDLTHLYLRSEKNERQKGQGRKETQESQEIPEMDE